MQQQPKVDWVEEKPFKTPAQDLLDSGQIKEKKKKSFKEMWNRHYGEGTINELRMIVILFLSIYIAVQVS